MEKNCTTERVTAPPKAFTPFTCIIKDIAEENDGLDEGEGKGKNEFLLFTLDEPFLRLAEHELE
jgi:hypothetical protein